MGRFERNQTEPEPSALASGAAHEFESVVQRELQGIVAAAQERAKEIERNSARDAKERERWAQLRADELTEAALALTRRVCDSIELLQAALDDALRDLRAEFEKESDESADLADEGTAEPPPLQATERPVSQERTPPPSEPAHAEEDPVTGPDRESARLTRPVPLKLIEQAGADTGSELERDEIVRAEIREMFRSGSSPDDVREFLGRFPFGNRYLDVVDQIHEETLRSGESSRRRGLRRRSQQR